MSIFIDPIIYEGAPEHSENREERELRTYRFLEDLDIPFKRLDHGAAMTMEDCDDVDAALDIEHCKNLFLRNTQKTEFYLLLMPHHKKFKTSVLSKQIGTARLSFAEEEFMVRYLDIHPGAVSILGLMNDTECKVHLLIDSESLTKEYMGAHPCVNTSSLKIKTSDIYDKFLKKTGHVPTYVTL